MNPQQRPTPGQEGDTQKLKEHLDKLRKRNEKLDEELLPQQLQHHQLYHQQEQPADPYDPAVRYNYRYHR